MATPSFATEIPLHNQAFLRFELRGLAVAHDLELSKMRSVASDAPPAKLNSSYEASITGPGELFAEAIHRPSQARSLRRSQFLIPHTESDVVPSLRVPHLVGIIVQNHDEVMG